MVWREEQRAVPQEWSVHSEYVLPRGVMGVTGQDYPSGPSRECKNIRGLVNVALLFSSLNQDICGSLDIQGVPACCLVVVSVGERKEVAGSFLKHFRGADLTVSERAVSIPIGHAIAALFSEFRCSTVHARMPEVCYRHGVEERIQPIEMIHLRVGRNKTVQLGNPQPL
jgi:hypothetical protein